MLSINGGGQQGWKDAWDIHHEMVVWVVGWRGAPSALKCCPRPPGRMNNRNVLIDGLKEGIQRRLCPSQQGQCHGRVATVNSWHHC